MSQKKTIIVEAPAKVNLYLEVLGERADGYHEIRSVMAPVSLCDELRIESTSDGRVETLTVFSPSLMEVEEGWDASSENNLVTKAANLLRDKTGCERGASIRLEKRIPVGGGLGGGSADAAAALRALNELWELGLSTEELIDISAELGSDIPGLVHGGIVIAEGRGERVNPLSTSGLQEMWMVLVNPMFPVCTKDIYTRCSSGLTSEAIPFSSMCSCLKEGDIEKVSKSMFNGLQETVLTKYPLIEIVAENICKAGAVGVLVSGSGASILGTARDEIHAREIEESVKGSAQSPIWTEVVRTLI